MVSPLAAVLTALVSSDAEATVSEQPGSFSADVTTPVCTEVAGVLPPALLALTTARSVCPTSPDASRRVLPVAPLIAEQLAPEELQSSHW
jgi:hypothetical protein